MILFSKSLKILFVFAAINIFTFNIFTSNIIDQVFDIFSDSYNQNQEKKFETESNKNSSVLQDESNLNLLKTNDPEKSEQNIIEQKILKIPFEHQKESLWCWAACSVNIAYAIKGESKFTQSELAELMIGDKDKNKATFENDMAIAVNLALGDDQNCIYTYDENITSYTESDFKQSIDKGLPVYISRKSTNSEPFSKEHDMLIFGYKKVDNTVVFLIFDPKSDCEVSVFENTFQEVFFDTDHLYQNLISLVIHSAD